ncbi:hypothetical protein BT96DRAFT_937173 [Gymnopus androsaceus JB14]|uniref:Uncharacterized protein n=1 Tax=Gymnopus androsaceus JB14 TaxID=1447944 RepID=A0A6A4HVN5_9AGAR|nr:hypothetical protein BT96DRAFT_937173 [Gymnopus androsaceus JB14]
MNPSILSKLFCIYFERYPPQAVTNDELGDTRGFSAETIADVRWYKEKLIIERTKETLEAWLSSMEEITDVEALAQVMPKFDVLPALDSDLRDWVIEVVNFIANLPQSPQDPETMVFKPLLSDAYSMTFHHSGSFSSEGGTDDEGSTVSESNGVPDKS